MVQSNLQSCNIKELRTKLVPFEGKVYFIGLIPALGLIKK